MAIASRSCSQSRVEPSTSVNKNETRPVGNPVTIRRTIPAQPSRDIGATMRRAKPRHHSCNTVKATNPHKVIYPAIGATKQDLIGHYEAVAGVMVPWLEGRPLTLERYPNGVDEKGFMQKNASSHFPPSIERIEVVRGSNAAAFGSNAAMGTINIVSRKPETSDR